MRTELIPAADVRIGDCVLNEQSAGSSVVETWGLCRPLRVSGTRTALAIFLGTATVRQGLPECPRWQPLKHLGP
jgi:hypothetical protein